MEWVEVRGRSVEVAVEAALQELGLSSAEEAEVQVLQEPEKGFLGIGGQDAIVRVKRRAPQRERRGRRRGRRQRRREGDKAERQEKEEGRPKAVDQRSEGRPAEKSRESQPKERKVPETDVDQQAAVVGEFLEGLLEAFGLEGQVATRIEDDVILADVTGGQTEALVGPKGSVMRSVHELCRTVVQRKTKAGARIRLDIAGYGERRREALRIYARRLAEKVLEEGTELMLEPMNAADRKVVHDAVLDIEGVRSFSEGKEPNRSVVIAPASEEEGSDD